MCFSTEKSHNGNRFLIKRIRKENRVLQLKIKHQDFTSKLDATKRKITKTKTNRYTSRLDRLKMKIYKVKKNISLPSLMFMHQQQLLLGKITPF